MGDILRKCLNWKVLAGLGAVGLAVWVLAPGLLAQAIPFLIVLVCPLSMLLMMRGMHEGSSSTPSVEEKAHTDGSGDHLAELRSELASAQSRKESLARQIRQLEASDPPGHDPSEEHVTR
jgi:hypothetical protein